MVFFVAMSVFASAIVATNIVFVGIAVALDAVLVVAYAFLDMLAADILRCVFVATITSVAAVVVTHMTGDAAHIVIAIQAEIGVVIEYRWLPLLLAMALAALRADFFMQRIGWGVMALLALCDGLRLLQGVIEAALSAPALHSGMIAMTSDAILFTQLLMKRHVGQRLVDRLALRCQLADVFCFVAVDAARWAGADKRGMAGEAVAFQFIVTGDQLARRDHQVRVSEGQCRCRQ